MMEQERKREQHERLLEMMDACRGEARDLERPELEPLRYTLREDGRLREVFDRVQALDDRVREAMHDVPVPADLEGRLLAAVAGRAGANAASEGEIPEVSAAARATPASDSPTLKTTGAETASTGGWRRRMRDPWWLAAAATAAVVLLSLAWFMGRGGQTIGEDQLVSAVQDWTRRAQAGEDWKSMAEHPPIEARPLSDAVRALPRRWMRLSALDDPSAAVYEIVPPRGDVPGMLFVVKTRRDCGLSAAPYRTLSTGGVASGWNIAAWQTPELLYVLVVPSDGPSLPHYVPNTPAV